MFEKKKCYLVYNSNPLKKYKGFISVKEKSGFEHLINDDFGRFSPKGFEAYMRISASEPRVVWKSTGNVFVPSKEVLIKQTTFSHIKYFDQAWSSKKGAYIKAFTSKGESVKIFSDMGTIRGLVAWAHSLQKFSNYGKETA